MAMLGLTERQQIAQALKESLAPPTYPSRNGEREKDNFLFVDGSATTGDAIIVNGRRLWRRHRAKPCAAEGCAGNAKAGGMCRKHGGNGKSGKEDSGSRPGRACGCSAPAGHGKLACPMRNAEDVYVLQGCSINSLAGETAYEKQPPHRNKLVCTTEGCRIVASVRGRCLRHGVKAFCSAAGCDRAVARRGLCIPHGAYGICAISDCKTAAVGRGRCRRHGGGRQSVCGIEGCTTPSQARNLCAGHGAYGRCQIDGCSTALGSGTSYCGTHGGRKTKPCIEPGCNTGAQKNRRCSRHGANGWCKFDGCTTPARQGFVHCIRHGGGKKKQCSVPGCTTPARSRTVCSKHDVLQAKPVSVGAQLNA